MVKFTLIRKRLETMNDKQRQLALLTFRQLWDKYFAQTQYYRELMSKQIITKAYYRRVTKVHRQDLLSQVKSNLRVIASL